MRNSANLGLLGTNSKDGVERQFLYGRHCSITVWIYRMKQFTGIRLYYILYVSFPFVFLLFCNFPNYSLVILCTCRSSVVIWDKFWVILPGAHVDWLLSQTWPRLWPRIFYPPSRWGTDSIRRLWAVSIIISKSSLNEHKYSSLIFFLKSPGHNCISIYVLCSAKWKFTQPRL